mmetsp:Transcript_66744/g.168450  ORF Transcript_66744/g.168450 Transcript_66744/m.168450 type:complete len:222 (-) Transcript_66744:7-672(-)
MSAAAHRAPLPGSRRGRQHAGSELLGLLLAVERFDDLESELEARAGAGAGDDVAILHDGDAIASELIAQVVLELRVAHRLARQQAVRAEDHCRAGAHGRRDLAGAGLLLQQCRDGLAVTQVRRARHAPRDYDGVPLLVHAIVDLAISHDLQPAGHLHHFARRGRDRDSGTGADQRVGDARRLDLLAAVRDRHEDLQLLGHGWLSCAGATRGRGHETKGKCA